MKASEFLELTKQELLEHGWTQRASQDLQGRHCLTGAMSAVMSAMRVDHRAFDNTYLICYKALSDKVIEITGDKNMRSLPGWNDRVAKSRQDVIDLCDKTIGWLQECGE